ncbi:MAG: hypothetical protein K1X88_01810 [Nannocystaceae bacterium]|nr:hypothetical protein [Nannocystaceae bacterium]
MRLAVLAGFAAVAAACYDPAPPGAAQTEGSSGGSDSGSDSVGTTATTSASASATDDSATTLDTTASASDTQADSSSSGGVIEPLPCVESVLDPAVGSDLAHAMTQSAGDDDAASCGGSGSPDVAYEWRVPYDGFFVLDTQGSDFDTVLYLRDGACDGPELACNDNGEGVGYSSITGPFSADQRVVVVLDGTAGESGTAQLNINPVECPSADVSGQSLPQGFSNVAGSNEHGGSCGGDGVPERAFRWTAPADGLWSFRATSSDFVPSLYLETGPVCGGPLLGCNADAGIERGEVVRNLVAGEYVTVWVDSVGGSGDFDLDIVSLPTTCPLQGYDGQNPYTDVIDDGQYVDHMTTSCGADGYLEGPAVITNPDVTLAWTSPGMVGANSGCDIVLTSGFPAALALQQGHCDGPEEQCANSVFDAGTMSYGTTVSVGHIPPTDFTIVISPIGPSFAGWVSSDFSLEIQCWAIA